jgi:hypothetical protein
MPMQQRLDPQGYGRQFLQRRQAYIDKYGQNAIAAIGKADEYATKARNARRPIDGGLGLQRYTPQYYKRMDDLLDLYAGQAFNAPYSSEGDKSLTADEAARTSGLSNREYNRAVKALQAQGRIGND